MNTAGDIVAIGGKLDPPTLLRAYRHGTFPMHVEGELLWWSPQRRGVLEPRNFIAGRSLQRALRRYTVSVDAAFGDVVDGCADPARPHGWINPEIREAYLRLYQLGHAHSVEVWDTDGELAGGLYGVALGGLFAAESKFYRGRDASKVALWYLCQVLRNQPGDRLIDVQWLTPHLASLGCEEVSENEYRERLPGLLSVSEIDWASLAHAGRTTPAHMR